MSMLHSGLLMARTCTVAMVAVLGLTIATLAQEQPLKPGEFTVVGTGTYLSGELVIIDPVNRRGGIRLDGNEPHDRYHSGPLHYFALLPYGMISYHGAPAELRDLPIGTHVHGYFYLPPAGDEGVVPPLPKDMEKYQLKQTHALTLEDDFSFYQRRGQSWKIASIDPQKGKINVAPAGQLAKDGINVPYTFDIDDLTKIWQGRKLVDLADIQPGQEVQLNLTWSPGWRDKEFSVAELWLDEDSRAAATDLQRRRHVKYQKQRWLPGKIDAVEDNDFGGGTVTLTLFGGMDPSLYADLKATQDKGFGVAVAEPSLRTWFHRSDKKIGQVVEWKEMKDPPPGSSGIQVRLKFSELLDGYRPGRIVRVKCHDWLFVTMPSEERLKSMEELERSKTFHIP